MRDNRVTIKELAHLSGVSIGTVSRALNGYTDVNPDTRERIMRLARELDYTPAAAARSLVTQRSHVIGVFLETGEGNPDLQHPFFHEVLVGLKHEIGARGYDLLLFASEHPGNGYGDHSYLKRAATTASRASSSWASTPRTSRSAASPAAGCRASVWTARSTGPATEFVMSDNPAAEPRRRPSARSRPPPHRDDHRAGRDPPGRRPPPGLPRRAAAPRPRLPGRVRRLRRLLRRVRPERDGAPARPRRAADGGRSRPRT